MGIFEVKKEYEEKTRPIKHIREDGKVLWQPRVQYEIAGVTVEGRYKTTRKHGEDAFDEYCDWFLEGNDSGSLRYPKLYPWKWYARQKALWHYKELLRKNAKEVRSKEMNTREVDE